LRANPVDHYSIARDMRLDPGDEFPEDGVEAQFRGHGPSEPGYGALPTQGKIDRRPFGAVRGSGLDHANFYHTEVGFENARGARFAAGKKRAW
jgi:hypothetical protein